MLSIDSGIHACAWSDRHTDIITGKAGVRRGTQLGVGLLSRVASLLRLVIHSGSLIRVFRKANLGIWLTYHVNLSRHALNWNLGIMFNSEYDENKENLYLDYGYSRRDGLR